MLPYIAEFIGTMLLILLGDGVVANVNLERSGMKGAGAVQITFAWGLAVLVPAFILDLHQELILTRHLRSHLRRLVISLGLWCQDM